LEGQNFKFPKEERLCSRTSIKELFAKGSSFYLQPFFVKFLSSTDDGNKVLFSVSKKNFKRAVDRNLLKRRMREAYRLNKTTLQTDKSYNIAFVYTSKEVLSFEIIQKRLILVNERLIKRVQKHEKQ